MPLILTSRVPWRRRPSGLVEIDRSSPQARGLAVWARATQTGMVTSSQFAVTGGSVRLLVYADAAGVGWQPVDTGSNGGYYEGASVYGMPSAGFTLSAWITVYDGPWAAGCAIKVGSGTTGYGLGIGDSTWVAGGDLANRRVVGLNENVSWLTGTSAVPLGLIHIAMVGHTAGGGTLYLDGRQAGTYASTAISPLTNTTVLSANGVTNRHLRGAIAHDVRAYAVPFSAAEVWQLYAPETRWSLYAPIVRRAYFDLGGAGGPSDLVCDAGTYTVTGHDATLTRARLLTCDAGSYSLTGQDASLTRARLLATDAGAYTLTGQDATLTRARVLTTEAGAYTLSGQEATLTAARAITLDAGSYSLTGHDATLTKGVALVADAGSYTVTGYDATLTWARALSVDAGSYTLTGNDASLAKLSAGTLDCDAGAYTLTGYDATLTWARVLPLDAGGYTVTGQDVTFTAGAALVCDAGSYGVTGYDVDLWWAHVLSADAGAYSLAGQAATVSYSGEVVQVADAERTWQAAPRDTTWRAKVRDTTWRGRRR